MSLHRLVNRQIRKVAGQDPIMPCGAETPHKSHTFPIFGPEGSKRYYHCEGVE
jgi:hypothetical protein